MNDTLDNELREIEAQLASLCPNKMPDDILKRMEQAMMAWEDHLPIEENIVPFNSTEHFSATSAPKKINLNTWGAAAAIALTAGLSFVFMSSNPEENSVTANNTSTQTKPAANLVIDNSTPELKEKLSRNITHASNEGITFAGKDDAPFKVLRIEYTEEVITKDKDGKPVTTKKPCVEHVLVPVPLH
jgi:hypothetical protein